MKFLLVILSFITSNVWASSTIYEEVDFDVSMGKKNLAQYNLMLRDEESKVILDFYRKAYYEQLPSKKVASKEHKIPKIIHQIWVSDRPMPMDAVTNKQSCRNIHKNWQYKLWTDKELKEAGYDKHPLYKAFQGNRIMQKEIVELQILRDHGGVVLDLDFICLQPLDELHHKYSFYSGLKPPSHSMKRPVLTASVIGSEKNNPILDKTLQIASEKIKAFDEQNNSYLKRSFRKISNYFSEAKKPVRIISDHEPIISAALGDVYMKDYDQNKNAIVFPCTYFSPLFPNQSKNYEVLDKIKLKMGVMTEQQVFSSKKPETIAVQYHQAN